MSITTHRAACSAADVFAVLSDGWLYPSWVVGASRVRGVDASWPAPGSAIHHSIGIWPALIDDSTVCTDIEAPRMMALRARGWPLGEAAVRIQLMDVDGGCQLTLHEEPVAGPAKLVPPAVADPLLHLRNRECLRRLAYLAEGRSR